MYGARAVSKTAASEANGSSSTLEWAAKGKNISMQFQSQGELDAYNNNLVDTNVHLMGDATVVAQVVQLIAYIRHALKNNIKTKIEVDMPNTVANVDFMMDVNGQQVPDLVTVKHVQVN